jgi:hypothetical protein
MVKYRIQKNKNYFGINDILSMTCALKSANLYWAFCGFILEIVWQLWGEWITQSLAGS